MLRLSELAKGDFLALDIEGDGNKNQRPVEISVCEFSHGAFVREHHWLINPERPISYFARVKHGIGDRKVRSAPKFTEVKEEIANLLAGRVVVAHDMTGDLLMLGEVDPSIIEYPGQIVCTYRMAKRVLPARQPVTPGVTSLSAWLGIDREMPDGLRRKTVHSSSLDAWRTGKIFVALAGKLPPDDGTQEMLCRQFSLSVKSLEAIRSKLAKPAMSASSAQIT